MSGANEYISAGNRGTRMRIRRGEVQKARVASVRPGERRRRRCTAGRD
jgi:hypothetical protein